MDYSARIERAINGPRTASSPVQDREAPQDTRRWSNDHPVNIRLSVPLLFGRFYITIVAGKERRSAERLSQERARHPLATAGNLLFMMGFGTLIGMGFLFAVSMAIRAWFAVG